MGCDEHMLMERKTENGWVLVLPPEPVSTDPREDAYWEPWGRIYKDKLEPYWQFNRNYEGYGFLAGVRSQRVTPIKQPAGIPEDACAEVIHEYTLGVGDFADPEMDDPGVTAEQFARWAGPDYGGKMFGDRVQNPDWHTASYLTLAELETWQATVSAPVTYDGTVDATNFQLYETRGYPDSWYMGVAVGPSRNVDNAQMRDMIRRGDTDWVYTRITWTRKVTDTYGYKRIAQLIEEMRKVADKYALRSDDLRIVFWFDN